MQRRSTNTDWSQFSPIDAGIGDQIARIPSLPRTLRTTIAVIRRPAAPAIVKFTGEMRRRSPPSGLSIVFACSSFLLVTAAVDLCQVGDKLTAATRDARGSLNAQCKSFVSEDCSVSCQWSTSCRDSAGWHEYASGSRSFVAGVRTNPLYGLLLRCCVSLASTISTAL